MNNFACLLAFLLLLSGCGNSQPKNDGSLLIAIASNVQFVMEELIADFEASHGIECNLVVSSSGKIAAQVMSGATFDIFVSADQDYPKALFERGFTEEPPSQYAKGALVLWSNIHNLKGDNFSLSEERFRAIAIANPKLAPYGIAAEAALKSLGIYEEVKERLVYGENISQVNQFVSVGAADIGITSKSVVFSTTGRDLGSWVTVPDSLHQPIRQDLVALKSGKASMEERQTFVDYMQSAGGRRILSKYGYAN